PARERIAVLEGALDAPAVSVRECGALYRRLREHAEFAGGELNVEGAVVVRDVLRLFQRGNGAARDGRPSIDATGDLPLEAFLAYLEDPLRNEAPRLTD